MEWIEVVRIVGEVVLAILAYLERGKARTARSELRRVVSADWRRDRGLM